MRWCTKAADNLVQLEKEIFKICKDFEFDFKMKRHEDCVKVNIYDTTFTFTNKLSKGELIRRFTGAAIHKLKSGINDDAEYVIYHPKYKTHLPVIFVDEVDKAEFTVYGSRCSSDGEYVYIADRSKRAYLYLSSFYTVSEIEDFEEFLNSKNCKLELTETYVKITGDLELELVFEKHDWKEPLLEDFYRFAYNVLLGDIIIK